MARRFQFSIADGLLATAVAAAVVATIAARKSAISFIAAGVLLLFIWHRPVLVRLWVVGTTGFGSGVLTAMFCRHAGAHDYLLEFGMYTDDLVGWGAGLLVGGLIAYRSFISNPPAEAGDGN